MLLLRESRKMSLDGCLKALLILVELLWQLSASTGYLFPAAVGVGARQSAAKSVKQKSISWPTAEIIGIGQWATSRVSASSLKAHKSSREPPPRPITNTSHCASCTAWARAVLKLVGASLPCTRAG